MKKTNPPAKPLEHASLPWLFAAALATSAPHASHQPLWLSAVAGLMLGWRVWLWHDRRPLPSRWLLTLLSLAGMVGVFVEYHTLFGRDAGVAMLSLFIALKLLEMREMRDAYAVLLLGYFLLLTHYFYSQSIPTAAWMLAALLLVTTALIRLHGGGGERPATSLRSAASLTAQALPFMLILYLLFPRISGPLWGLPQDAYSGLTGLSDSMAPGSMSNLIRSGAIAFRAEFAGPPPPQRALYWRGPVLDDYDGQTWRARTLMRAMPPHLEMRSAELPYTLTIEPHNQRWLLALDLPNRTPPNTFLTYDFQLLAREPLRSRTRIDLAAVVDYRANADGEARRVLDQALQLPPGGNPRSRQLAARWRAESSGANDSAQAIVQRALQHFRNEPFFYTLQPPLLGEQAMDDFLFESRRGFCEHYASAFVFLMRAAGVPARVVTGYQGGEANPIDHTLVIRQSDAHAWAEVWIAGRGWLRVDPTAAVSPARVEQGIAAALPADEALPLFSRADLAWLAGLRYRWEAVNHHWNRWVLGYNPQRQREVLAQLGLHADWRELAAWLTALCGITLLALLGWTLRQRRLDDPALRAWLAFCARLARQGVRRQGWQGPQDFAAQVARQRPSLAPLASEAAALYSELRYGRHAGQAGAAPTAALRRLKALSRKLPRWRKL